MWKGNLLLLWFTGVDVQCLDGSGDEIHSAESGEGIYGTESLGEIDVAMHGADRGPLWSL